MNSYQIGGQLAVLIDEAWTVGTVIGVKPPPPKLPEHPPLYLVKLHGVNQLCRCKLLERGGVKSAVSIKYGELEDCKTLEDAVRQLF